MVIGHRRLNGEETPLPADPRSACAGGASPRACARDGRVACCGMLGGSGADARVQENARPRAGPAAVCPPARGRCPARARGRGSGLLTDLIECALVWQGLPNDGSGAVTEGPGCARMQPSARWPTSGRRTRRRGCRRRHSPGLGGITHLVSLPPLHPRVLTQAIWMEAKFGRSGTNLHTDLGVL